MFFFSQLYILNGLYQCHTSIMITIYLNLRHHPSDPGNHQVGLYTLSSRNLMTEGIEIETSTKKIYSWLVVSTHLKNMSQIGSFPQVGVKKKYLKPQPRLERKKGILLECLKATLPENDSNSISGEKINFPQPPSDKRTSRHQIHQMFQISKLTQHG